MTDGIETKAEGSQGSSAEASGTPILEMIGVSKVFGGVHALRAMVYDTQVQGVMLMQAFSEPKKPWRINSEIGDQRGLCISGVPLLDFQRMDVSLEGRPKNVKAGDPIPPMTSLERIIGRELEAATLDALDLMDNGKKTNLDLLLEVGQGLAVGSQHPFGIERAQVPIGEGGRLLHHGERFDEFGKVIELDTGDREILDGAGGVDAIVGVERNGHFAD